jgi:hypothetical protein
MHCTSFLSVGSSPIVHQKIVHKKIAHVAAILANLLLLLTVLPARGQDGSSLADAARQARAQKQAQPKAETSPAQQIADQLAEDPKGDQKDGRKDKQAPTAPQKGTPAATSAVIVSPKPAPGSDAAVDPAKAAAPAPTAAQPASAGGPVSLADIARQLHQPAAPGTTAPAAQPAPATVAVQSTVPAGFKVQAFTYCKSHTQQCWNASVLVPTDAQLVSSDCKQYVFETKVKGSPFLFLMGPAGADSCPGRNPSDGSTVRWKQLVDPERERDPGTSSTMSAEQTTLDGKLAYVTQMRFRKGAADWIAKRAEVENNDAQLVVGCMAPKDTFADGDAICSGLIESLRLP